MFLGYLKHMKVRQRNQPCEKSGINVAAVVIVTYEVLEGNRQSLRFMWSTGKVGVSEN